MKLVLLGLALVVGYASAQFVNGRILEPPVPHLCAKRVIHERGPNGKSLSYFSIFSDVFVKKSE